MALHYVAWLTCLLGEVSTVIAQQRIVSKAVLNTKAALFQALLKPSLQIEVPSGREKQESMNQKQNEHKSEWGPGSVATYWS